MKDSAVRERILDVASRLFYEQGYNSTGINQIIEEADIAKASLYHHFASKTDLLSAYLQETDERSFTLLNSFIDNIKDPRKKVLGIFDYRINRQLASNFKGCQFIKISSEAARDDEQVFELVARNKARMKAYIKTLLVQSGARHETMPVAMLADALFLLLEGATISVTINKDPDALRTAKKIAEKLI